MDWHFSRKSWYGWPLTANARCSIVGIMEWKRSEFEQVSQSVASYGTIQRRGYIRGPFGIAKDRGDWIIFHLPTGMMFLYSVWPTLAEAKRYAEALLARGAWGDAALCNHPHRFNTICDEVADALGEPRRTMRRIC